jgi:hypothetical protein
MRTIPALALCSTLAVFSLACGDDGSGGAGGGTSSSATSGANSTTGNASSTTGAQTGSTNASTGTSQQLDCNTYCTGITATCTGPNKQYFGTNAAEQIVNCNTICERFNVGTFNDAMDSLGCRTYHLEAAGVDQAAADMHCEHAGPLGGAICGTDERKNFCALAVGICSELFPSGDLCETDIAAIDVATAYSQEVTAGPSLACRMYHLTAAVTDAQMHCPHADGAAPCQ